MQSITKFFMSGIEVIVEFLIFRILFPGGPLYWIWEFLYINFFDSLVRQKGHEEKIAVDWENPR